MNRICITAVVLSCVVLFIHGAEDTLPSLSFVAYGVNKREGYWIAFETKRPVSIKSGAMIPIVFSDESSKKEFRRVKVLFHYRSSDKECAEPKFILFELGQFRDYEYFDNEGIADIKRNEFRTHIQISLKAHRNYFQLYARFPTNYQYEILHAEKIIYTKHEYPIAHQTMEWTQPDVSYTDSWWRT